MSAPTKEGRGVLDRIAGFKQYLSITERERLDRMQAPEDSLQLFERYLPYAIALGVENRWADRYTGLLAAAAAAPGGQPGLRLVFGLVEPVERYRRFRRFDRLVAGQHDQLRLDRSRIIQRLGRRRFVGRRRRRRRWRRLVRPSPRPGAARQWSDRRGRSVSCSCRKPSRSASLIEGAFAGAMMAQIGVGSERCLGPVEHRAAGFAGDALPMHFMAEDPAHFRLFAEFGVEAAPGGEEAGIADQPAIASALDRPGAEAD